MIKALRSLYSDYSRDLYRVIGTSAAPIEQYVTDGMRKQASLSVLGQFPVAVDTDLFSEALEMYVTAYIGELAAVAEIAASDAKVTQRTYGARGTTSVRGAGTTTTQSGVRKSKDTHGRQVGSTTTTVQPETTTTTESFATAGGPNVAPVRREQTNGRTEFVTREDDSYVDNHEEDPHTTTVEDAARTDTTSAQGYTDTETQTVTAPERADLTAEQWDRAFAILRRWLADAVVYAQAVRW